MANQILGGQVYLFDFSSVKTITSNFEHTIVGTYGYMAPKQLVGQAVPASDLYIRRHIN